MFCVPEMFTIYTMITVATVQFFTISTQISTNVCSLSFMQLGELVRCGDLTGSKGQAGNLTWANNLTTPLPRKSSLDNIEN